jgi:hypothetical protein
VPAHFSFFKKGHNLGAVPVLPLFLTGQYGFYYINGWTDRLEPGFKQRHYPETQLLKLLK